MTRRNERKRIWTKLFDSNKIYETHGQVDIFNCIYKSNNKKKVRGEN